jgi:hypothetical protein
VLAPRNSELISAIEEIMAITFLRVMRMRDLLLELPAGKSNRSS